MMALSQAEEDVCFIYSRDLRLPLQSAELVLNAGAQSARLESCSDTLIFQSDARFTR